MAIHPVALRVVGPCPQQSSPRCRSTSGSSGALLCREKRYCRSDLTSLDIISWFRNALVGGWVELDRSDPIRKASIEERCGSCNDAVLQEEYRGWERGGPICRPPTWMARIRPSKALNDSYPLPRVNARSIDDSSAAWNTMERAHS